MASRIDKQQVLCTDAIRNIVANLCEVSESVDEENVLHMAEALRYFGISDRYCDVSCSFSNIHPVVGKIQATIDKRHECDTTADIIERDAILHAANAYRIIPLGVKTDVEFTFDNMSNLIQE